MGKNKRIWAALAVASVICSGCWDRVELENRAFVMSLGIDENKEEENKKRYTITMAIPDVGALVEKAGSAEENKSVKTANNETVSGAMSQIDSFSSKKLYFGHSKLVIFSKKILEDELLFKEALDALDRNREIGRKVLILSTDEEAGKVLKAKASGEPMVGMYVANFFKNNKGTSAAAFEQDLGKLVRELKETGHALLPKISLEDKEIKIGGAGVIKDYKLVGFLDETHTRGYLWVTNEGKNSHVNAELSDITVPLKVNNTSSRVVFQEQDGILLAIVDVSVKGVIDEFILGDEALYQIQNSDFLKEEYQKIISQEMIDTFRVFQNELHVDGFRFLSKLRKKDYALYQIYENNWDKHFEKMQIVPRVNVEITNTGAVK